MTKPEFIKLIQDDLTISCSLPYNVPEKEIDRIIKIESEYFYREYRDAIMDQIYVLDWHYFRTVEFNQSRSIVLPDCVVGVQVVWEITDGQKIWGINDPDLSFDRVVAADMYLAPWSSDTITYRTMQWSFWDLTKSFNLIDVQHDFNINTHRLFILGRTPCRSLFVVTKNKIELEKLFEDPIFQKWVMAKAKIQLSKIIGLFNYNLIGGVTINYSLYSEEGKSEITELKQYITDNNPPDWFYMIN